MPTASRLPPPRPNRPPGSDRPIGRLRPAARPDGATSPPKPAAKGPAKGKKAWRQRFRGGALGLIAVLFAAVVIAGVALRFTVKDGVAPLAPAFYALSVPVLVLLGGAAAVFAAMAFGLRLTWKRLLLAAGVALVLGLYMAIFLFQDATFDDRPRVVLWNTANGVAGWDGVADALAENDPTLAVLVESGWGMAEGGGSTAFWKARFPDHFVARPGGALTILSRGPIGRTELIDLPGGGTAASVKTKVGGRRATLLAVDLPSDPTADRGAPLRKVAELAAALAADRPVLVAGDFNTPPDSVHFAALRRAGFTHAFERHGRGYAATWPVPAPVLHLDHVWLSPGFDVGEAWHGWSAHSDHRPVLVPLRVVPEKFAASRSPRTEDE